MAPARQKPLNEQVMVITGASSGIGLATARLAAQKGVRLVLAARSVNTLSEIVEHMRAEGSQCVSVECDVSNPDRLQHVANTAVETFGRIDTWVNNAGVSIYGRLDEVSEADSRRLFEVNFWGTYYGSLIALPYLKQVGGTLINVGSEVSEAVVPLQGIYSASKHAVKGFTDALRVEVEDIDKAPVSITLIQPTAVDTPYPQHARNYMELEPKLPSPQIQPDDVAEAILEAATSPVRDKKVGAMASLNVGLSKLMPALADKLGAKRADDQQYDEPPRNPEGALYQPSETTGVVGETHGTGGRE